MVGEMNCSTPANKDPCQEEMPNARNPKLSQERHGSNGKSAHANIDIDTQYIIKDVYVPEEFRRPHMIVNTVPVKQYKDDYIRPNADLETKLQIRSNEHLKCMYSECCNDIGGFSW